MQTDTAASRFVTLLIEMQDEPGILDRVSRIVKEGKFNIENGITHTILSRAVVFMLLAYDNNRTYDMVNKELKDLVGKTFPDSNITISKTQLDTKDMDRWQPFLWRVQFSSEDFPGLLANSLEAMRGPEGIDVDVVSWSGTSYRTTQFNKPVFVMAFAIRPTKNLDQVTFRERFIRRLGEICAKPVDLENLIIESL